MLFIIVILNARDKYNTALVLTKLIRSRVEAEVDIVRSPNIPD